MWWIEYLNENGIYLKSVLWIEEEWCMYIYKYIDVDMGRMMW